MSCCAKEQVGLLTHRACLQGCLDGSVVHNELDSALKLSCCPEGWLGLCWCLPTRTLWTLRATQAGRWHTRARFMAVHGCPLYATESLKCPPPFRNHVKLKKGSTWGPTRCSRTSQPQPGAWSPQPQRLRCPGQSFPTLSLFLPGNIHAKWTPLTSVFFPQLQVLTSRTDTAQLSLTTIWSGKHWQVLPREQARPTRGLWAPCGPARLWVQHNTNS